MAGTAGITAAAAMECGPAGARMAARLCVLADGRIWVVEAGPAAADRVAADGPVAVVMAAVTAVADIIAKTYSLYVESDTRVRPMAGLFVFLECHFGSSIAPYRMPLRSTFVRRS